MMENDLGAKLSSINEVTKKNEENIETKNNTSVSTSFSVFDLAVFVFSCVSVISDVCTDLVLVIEYGYQGYKEWAVATFTLVFFPSVIVQFFSMRWFVVDKSVRILHWLVHFFILGIIYRYFILLKSAYKAFKTKDSSDIEQVYLEQSDLCMLHLFESFLESAPQLVLQIYVIAMLKKWKFWTVLSAAGSLLSLSWALAAYTKSQRLARVNKKSCTWIGLLLQATWRTGMLMARITALVLAAYCFKNYFFVFIFLHWIIMTIWIIFQETDFCDTKWEEKIYNAVVGVIYCFCFFNLQEGQSRWRLLTFYLIIIFQNLTFLTIFLMWFGNTNPKMAICSFVAIVGGIVLGTISMLTYYRFFHPSGPIKFFFVTEEPVPQEVSSGYSTLTIRSLKRNHTDNFNNISSKNISQSETNKLSNSFTQLSESIVIVEEKTEDSDTDIKVLENWIKQDIPAVSSDSKNVSSKNKIIGEIEEGAYKRRAICSSVDLVKLVENKCEDTHSDVSLKFAEVEETPSEILSTHDYENLCAVNIAREAWGLRSWKGYSDIETWLHDDSVVNERRLETLTSTTTSSDHSSGNTLDKSNEFTRHYDIDCISNDFVQTESEVSSNDILDNCYVESFPTMYVLGPLDPIFEEIEEQSTSTDLSDNKLRGGSISTLVATIDEIRRNTPIQNRYQRKDDDKCFLPLSIDNVKSNQLREEELPEILSLPIRAPPKRHLDLKEIETNKKDNAKKGLTDLLSTIKNEQGCKRVERHGTNNSDATKIPLNSASPQKNLSKENNKENMKIVANKISTWNKILSTTWEKKTANNVKVSPFKRVNVKERRKIFMINS